MVLPKSSVHLSRFAGTALKSFTHGYAQTVVAASQSSYASQNTPVAPLASNFISRFGKGNKAQEQHALHSTLSHNVAANAAAKHDATHNDSGLAQYYDAWHKLQKVHAQEWQQYQFVKRIGWQAPTTVPHAGIGSGEAVELESLSNATSEIPERDGLKRSYSTSAIDNFTKAIDDKAVEAAVLAHVSDTLADEAGRPKDSVEIAKLAQPADGLHTTNDVSPQSDVSGESAHTTAHTASTAPTSIVETDPYTSHLEELFQAKDYAQIPAAFEAILRAGISKPSQLAYRALLSSALALTPNKHQKVPRVLEVYSDMLRRKVLPDAQTYAILIDTLAVRALEAVATGQSLEHRSHSFRVPGLDRPFIFRSDEFESAVLSEDQSLSIGLRILNNAPADTSIPVGIYECLIKACAAKGQLVEMMKLYGDLENRRLVPQANLFPTMIEAFAKVGDLRNAVECYNEYKDLAIANDAGFNQMTRADLDVYSALIKAYGSCQRRNGGERFLKQIEAEEPIEAKRQLLRDTVSLKALLPLDLSHGLYKNATTLVNGMSSPTYSNALELISTTAAEQDNVLESTKAFDALVAAGASLAKSASSIIAMHVRNGDVEAAEPFWRVLESTPASMSFVDPTMMRSLALISVNQIVRGLHSARNMFGRVREVERTKPSKADVSERVEEAIEVLGHSVSRISSVLPADASVELLKIMVENSTLVSPFAEQAMASFGPDQIAQLAPPDIDVLLQVQSKLILDESAMDVAGPSRFAYLLENIVSRTVLPSVTTENLIEKTLVNLDRNDLTRMWNDYRYRTNPGFAQPFYVPSSPFASFLPTPAQPSFDDSFDPYASQTDNKGSVTITDLLEKSHGRPLTVLNDALTKFRNIRRAGRHPRFFAYSKLINAAAKLNHLDTCKEILEMAKRDVPLLPQYRVVRYGWISILDSMLAACLMTGKRDLAAGYHGDLIDMGAAPSANTYGLYITTLKENTQTFDEASEAVKIFLRSKAEGVEPTSFLYNALIGKLGKARRIDDCLYYFGEMRNLGIKPTSVTYGTIVNALCRVSDEKFAEEIFEEMESCANYRPRPAPYHSLMQYFLTTKRDRSKVLSYYKRMRAQGIEPTMHTYKLLIDAHATLEPIDMAAAENVLEQMHNAGVEPEAVHYASLIHAKGCVLHDMAGARAIFDLIVDGGKARLQPCVYQALFESLVANRQMVDSDALLAHMRRNRVELTPYIANALIHGWIGEKNLIKAQAAFGMVHFRQREPSTYEAMVRAHIAIDDREGAKAVVTEALGRGYPGAVAGKIAELLGAGRA